MAENTDKTYCYRHPDRETRISCNECGRYICTSCMIQAPVGQKCPQCITSHESHTTLITNSEYALSILAGGLIAFLLSYVWNRLAGFGGIFIMILTAYLLGFIIAKAISKIIGHKVGYRIQVIAGTLVFVGMLYNPVEMINYFFNSGGNPFVLMAFIQRPLDILLAFLAHPIALGYPQGFIISVVIGIWAAVRHFRF